MKKQSIAFIVLAGCAFCAGALVAENTPTYYLQKDVPVGGNPFLLSNGYWGDVDGNPVPDTDGTGKIPANADYVIKGNPLFNFHGHIGEFYAKSLRLGDISTQESSSFLAHEGSVVINHLILERGGYYYSNSPQKCITNSLSGTIEVRSPPSKPFIISHDVPNYINHCLEISSTVTGESGVQLTFGRDYSQNAPSNSTFLIDGDWSGYKGDINVGSKFVNTDTGFGVRFCMHPNALAGKITMGPGTILATVPGQTALSVGSLELQSGSRLEVAAGGEADSGVIVTDSFTKGNGNVDLWLCAEGGLAQSQRVLAVPSGTGLALGDFNLKLFAPSYARNLWSLADGGESAGLRQFVYKTDLEDDLVYQTISDDWGTSPTPGSSMTIAEHWSDLAIPHSDAHYFVVGKCLRTPYLPNDTFVFPGSSIRLSDGACLSTFCGRFTVPQLFSYGTNSIQTSISQTVVEPSTKVVIEDGRLDVNSNGYYLFIQGDISGSGDLWLTGASSSPYGSLYLYGKNTDFQGSMLLTNLCASASWNGGHQTLAITNGAALGGALDAFNPHALDLSKGARLLLRFYPIVFDGALNRGMFVRGECGIVAEDPVSSAAINWPITYAGQLHLSAAVSTTVFSLGATARFSDGTDVSAESPTEGMNGLVLDKGKLRPTVAHALDGVTLRFVSADYSKLVLPVNWNDAELLAKGICNTKTDTPFVLAEGTTKLPLSVELPGNGSAPSDVREIGLLTVSATAADAVESMLPKFPAPFRHVARVANADGTVTFKLVKHGLVLVVR